MDQKTAELLIIRFINGTASQEDKEALGQWLEVPKNERIFKEYIKTNYAADYSLKSFNPEKIKIELSKKIQGDKNIFRRKRIQTYFKYAAIIIVCLGIGYFYQQGNIAPLQEIHLIPGEEPITLQHQDGRLEQINPEDSKDIFDEEGNLISRQNQATLTYNDETVAEVLKYNTLKVPYGKRFQIVLSDGTTVHLNAGTSLRYPVKFIEGEMRKVFLTGEAFFDVTEDKEHPFIVNAEALNVQVIGTRFNVTSYPENPLTDVVLVEGLVGLYNEGNEFVREENIVLKPGNIALFNRSSKTIDTKEVVTGIYTSWMKGELIFKNMRFEDILKKMERHYNINIENKNAALNKVEFTAAFSNEPIEKVLYYLRENYGIQFTVKDNTVIIE